MNSSPQFDPIAFLDELKSRYPHFRSGKCRQNKCKATTRLLNPRLVIDGDELAKRDDPTATGCDCLVVAWDPSGGVFHFFTIELKGKHIRRAIEQIIAGCQRLRDIADELPDEYRGQFRNVVVSSNTPKGWFHLLRSAGEPCGNPVVGKKFKVELDELL